MLERDTNQDIPTPNDPDVTDAIIDRPESARSSQDWGRIWELLLRLGLGEVALRFGTALTSIVLVLLVVWVMSQFYLSGQIAAFNDSAIAASLPTATAPVSSPQFNLPNTQYAMTGISRNADLHTSLPVGQRFETSTYVVQQGDTVTGIAEKFGLKPQTILFGNYYTLADDPHRLTPGQELTILPVDGVYYEWHAGDGLNGVAQFFGVAVEDIVNFSGNNLDPATLGDYTNPNIEPGTWLVVPGGWREFVSWSSPRITRENPAVASIFGSGSCGEVMEGPIGSGTFIYPTVETYLSGFDYSPETNHFGLDFAGQTGSPIYAVDGGVVVYAGWNDWGYGNVVVVDHGNGWQSLYAHLSAYSVGCGSYVYQGDPIAAVGNTGNSSGPHLHFELRSDTYGKANPWNFLP